MTADWPFEVKSKRTQIKNNDLRRLSLEEMSENFRTTPRLY